MKGIRWLGLPAAAALAVVLFALTAGIGSARTAAAPKNTSPPTISGKAQVGELLTADKGTWSGSPTSFAYQWRICGTQGEACHDISGATGTEYSIKSADLGNTIRLQVTGTNADGSDTATSVPTALIVAAATPTPASDGCPKLAAGATSAAVTDVSPPARLQIDQVQTSPGVITRGTGAFIVKVHVGSTCGNPVSGANVYMTGVPFGMISSGKGTSGSDGWVSFQVSTLKGFPATTQQRLLVMFVKASKPGDPVLAGISVRRLVSVHVNLNG